MSLDLNMTATSREVFPTLVATAGPILECARLVSKDPSVRTLDVPVFASVTAREFLQTDSGHTADAANNTKISVTTSDIYHIMKMNQLQAGQTGLQEARQP